MKLHLSLTVSGEVQTSIDWPEGINQRQREVFQGDVTTILSAILRTCRNQTNPDEVEKKLTQAMVWNLANTFTTKRELMTLAVTDLKVQTTKVSRCLTNNNDDFSMAMFDILSEWNISYDNKRTAYKELCKTLEAVYMSALISEALDGHPDEVGKKLTDPMVLNLAKKFTTKREVMTLAVTGLKVETSQVSRCLTNNKGDISMAMHDVLSEWNSSHGDKKIAYKILCKALDDVNMGALINEALEGH